MAISYRDATPHDAAAIIDFQLAMARETEDVSLDRPICTRGVQAVFDDRSHGRYFVAEADGRVAASSDWRNGVVWWIQSVYVRPEMRGQRIYAGLYDHVKSIAASDPRVRGIRLYVDRRNTAAQEVYRRMGMNGEHYLVFEWMK
ncbi:MAG: GNAT family N-acetyltransferase [Acidobacteria bacterium]|nr:MAG: GNAT family N-acetyltransferase [Acidobacteriota bacterium]